MTLAPGTKFGPYEVVAPIGAGGMGEVYKARDTRLDRSVAIKVLPAEFAGNAQLRIRFEREARAISQLTHPHICTLFDVGENYLVMELLDGETLAERLSRGALPVAEAVRLGIQIADGLDAAHRAGIIHRDLKPGNVMVTSTGVKILDFGLAKSATTPSDPAAATLQRALTAEGTIVGTLQYMAPEQLEGRETDGRADIFALGAILYEMVSGRRAFSGDSGASIIARILGADPPPLTTLKEVTPPALDRIVKRCLIKRPALRWQCAGDVRRELELMEEEPPRAEAPRRWRAAALIAALGIIAAAEGIWLAAHRSQTPAAAERLVRFTVDAPPNQLIKVGNEIGPPALSPDGKSLAFVGVDSHSNRRSLWVRDLASVEAKRIEGSEGASFPFWSPDGKSLGFFAGGKLKRVDLDGGAPLALADASFARGGVWCPDGKIVFVPEPFGPFYRVSDRGGALEQITRLDEKAGETTHRWPALLPDGRHVLLLSRGLGKDSRRADTLFVVDLKTGERKLVGPIASMVAYANGSLVYVRERTLFAQPFDLKTMQFSGEPVPVAQRVQTHGNGYAMFAVSATGVLCYQTGAVISEMRWVDRHGTVLTTFGEAAEYLTPSLDAAHHQFVVSMADRDGSFDVWHYDMERNIARRLTFDPADEWSAILSPEGRRVAFLSTRSSFPQIFIKSIDGAEPERQIVSTQLVRFPLSWSADGNLMAYRELASKTQADIDILDLRSGTWRRFLATPFAETDAAFAPSGRWLAYVSDESGRPEIYVASFPDGSSRWQISSGGGSQPRWRGDEKELFYCAADGDIVAVPIDARSGFKAGLPQRLFAGELRTSRDDSREYDVSPDGQRFLLDTTAGHPRSLPLTIAIGALNR